MDRDQLFGGNPVGVLVRLVIVSIVVGIVLKALNIDPANLFYHIDMLARRIYNLGFDAFEWLLRYFLVGAVVVFPIWIIARLLGLLGKRSDDRRV